MHATSQADFERDGFEIIRGVLDKQSILTLRESSEKVFRSHNLGGIRNICDGWVEAIKLSKHLGVRFADGLSCVRGIIFDKTPDRNWPVAWHQDLTIAVREKRPIAGYGPWSVKEGVVHVQPPIELLQSMITLRVHLDDVPENNGPLRVIPGSHLTGKISPDEISNQTTGSYVCTCGAGDLLKMSPLLLHASNRSKMPVHRRVLHFEYADRSRLSGELAWRW